MTYLMRKMITTEMKQHKEELEELKAKILELTRLVEPIYNKEFWETFIKDNGNEFEMSTALLYLYWKDEKDTEFEVEEDHVILKVHSTNLEIRKVEHPDEPEEDKDKIFHEIYYVPFYQITDVSLTTDYIED